MYTPPFSFKLPSFRSRDSLLGLEEAKGCTWGYYQGLLLQLLQQQPQALRFLLLLLLLLLLQEAADASRSLSG